MDDCIFCRLVRGELPISKIDEDEHTLSFLNIMAAHPGHGLVIVKPHVENIYSLDDTLAAAVFQATARLARAVKAATGCDGVTLFQANEVAGGQTVLGGLDGFEGAERVVPCDWIAGRMDDPVQSAHRVVAIPGGRAGCVRMLGDLA